MLHYLRKGERQLSDRALSRLAAAESAAGIFYPVESPRVTAATTMQFQAGFKEFMAALQFMNNQIQADPELRALPFEQALERWRQKHDKNP